MTEAQSSRTDGWPGDALRATGVSRAFAGIHALRDVTLELHRHEVVGLIGPNGAGKTTLVNVLTGFDLPSAGTVELAGQDITSWSPHRRGRTGLARTFQHSRSFAGLTVRENVEVAALGSGVRPREARRRAAEAARAARAAGARGDRRRAASRTATSASSASPGRSRRSRASSSSTSRPPDCRRPRCRSSPAVVRSVRDDHAAGVLLIDHNMALVMDVCDRIQVLDQGRTLAEGTPAEIRANLDVTAAYLGEAPVAEE